MHIIQNLRNIFDQYDQEENRLTHSLLHTLASNKTLFKDFIKFAIHSFPFDKKDEIFIGTQGRYTGEIKKVIRRKTETISIPDALIHDKSGKVCILIECKVTSPIKRKQLNDHLRLIKRYGFEKSIILLITTDKESPEKFTTNIRKRNEEVHWIPWWKLYQWIDRYKEQHMVKDFREYMELLESNIINRTEQWEGMLTMFNGIPFCEGEPYSYMRAKWCLNALVDELRNHHKLKKIYPTANITQGRGAITGREFLSVWDCIPLGGEGKYNFTKHPHLTCVIRSDCTQVQITLPKRAQGKYWQNFTAGGKESIKELLLIIHKILKKGLRRKGDVKLYVEVLHRHYRTRRDIGVRDGEMHFNVDCLVKKRKFDPQVKTPTVWLDALHSILKQRSKVNLQIAIVARYDYIKGSIVGKPEFVDEAIRAINALKPFYNKMTKGEM